MSFLDAIKNQKKQGLRKTNIENDLSAPKLEGCMDEITPAYEFSVLDCNIEQWVHLLGPKLTFATEFVPLTPHHARLLMDAYVWSTALENEEKVQAAALAYEDSGAKLEPLNHFEDELFQTLGADIQAAMDKMGGSSFVKTSSRSAKDSASRTGMFRHVYKSSLQRLISSKSLTKNDKMKALCEAEMFSLRYRDASRVIRALTLSERIWQDMKLALGHVDRWKENVVVRKWEEGLSVDMEFRTFVHNNKFTAISQYAYNLYSPRLPTHLAHIAKTLTSFFQTHLHPILSTNNFSKCVVDLAIVGDLSVPDPKVMVIEINPFWETTDGALFSWTKERDLLEGKREGFEYPVVRITERPLEGALVMVPAGWKKVAEEVERECGVDGVFK
ncbi:hypothetical protein HK097_008512 [Rhizophlyctis rosea]|uniref:Cell division cycle protein 123 n=1 Tax=Rhizophlyctis rosea TaxID=64517 RepID=A0AAD5SA81_9FUNG|nr:hypothetical protein HK097_008512 [Rhizophlyctis rosea]